ncbi:hypothetical protein [uncultured Sphingomonas sp.]|uniref:hypothetical protein n=1 Tax=uncultured Sphingomonas sp. TaxID=158754 RepID=UPI00374A6AED
MQTSPELLAALDRVRGYKMTPAERFEQRVSFVYGQMSARSTLSKDKVRAILRGG